MARVRDVVNGRGCPDGECLKRSHGAPVDSMASAATLLGRPIDLLRRRGRMTSRFKRVLWVAAVPALSQLSCDANGQLGVARQRDACYGPIIGNVVVDRVTYHWEDPEHLLESAEGLGPRTLFI